VTVSFIGEGNQRKQSDRPVALDTEAQSAFILPSNSKQVVVHYAIYLSCCVVVYATGRDRRCHDLMVVVSMLSN
jgi:hypothetical protein